MGNDLIHMPELRQIAEVMGKTKMFGKGPEELLPLMLIAQAEGKHPAIAAQEYDIIQGRPAINAKSALARFQAAGGVIEWVERSETKASAIFSHPQCKPVKVTWTMDDATRAGLAGKDNWKKWPRQMLSARVEAEGVRACYPACLSGLYTVEETRDMEPRNVTPKRDETKIEIVPDDEKGAAQDVQAETVRPEDYKAKTERLQIEIYSAAEAHGVSKDEARKRVLKISQDKMANVITEDGVIERLETLLTEMKQEKTA